jgi:hypothetical protein
VTGISNKDVFSLYPQNNLTAKMFNFLLGWWVWLLFHLLWNSHNPKFLMSITSGKLLGTNKFQNCWFPKAIIFSNYDISSILNFHFPYHQVSFWVGISFEIVYVPNIISS